MIVESGRFPWDNGRFPLLTEPSPAYHDLNFWENFREYGYLMQARIEVMRDVGAALSPFHAFLLLLGLETLSLRMQRHVENAAAVARFLAAHPQVAWVELPDLRRQPVDAAGAEVPARTGPGAVFTFGVQGGYDAGMRFIEAVEPGLAPGQRRRRQDAGDPPGVDDPPAGPARRARGDGHR